MSYYHKVKTKKYRVLYYSYPDSSGETLKRIYNCVSDVVVLGSIVKFRNTSGEFVALSGSWVVEELDYEVT
jgi:hypothetical protein